MNQTKSSIVTGKIWHARMAKAKHTFEYPVYFFELDVDRLSDLEQKCFLFGFNRWNVLSIREKDFLRPGSESLRQKVEALLIGQGITEKPFSIQVVTQLRYWGWVFNPVSFFFCRNTEGKLLAVIADVNNTFGEGHAYVLSEFALIRPDCFDARAPKVFHVSPFFDRKGEYRFEFDFSKTDEVRIVLDYYEGGNLLLASSWVGNKKAFETSTALSTLCRYPFAGWLTVIRIHIHAFVLHFVKKLPIYSKPKPDHEMTLRRKAQNNV